MGWRLAMVVTECGNAGAMTFGLMPSSFAVHDHEKRS